MNAPLLTPWKCFLCWKVNEADATLCGCCHRQKAYGPKSLVDSGKAQPLALHGIASARHPFREDQIKALLSTGFDPLAMDTNGWTALHCAARLGQDEVVHNIVWNLGKESMEHLVEAASAGGWRALLHAIAGGHLRAVEELLLANADANARLCTTEEGLTPLHLAAMLGHTRIIDLLLQCSAAAESLTLRLGKTALHLAIEGGPHIESTRLLCAKTDLVLRCDSQGLTPLQQAHLLPTEAIGRSDVINTLETALRERGAGDQRLLPAFLAIVTRR